MTVARATRTGLAAAFVVLLRLSEAHSASAETPRVAVLRPSVANDVTSEAVLRVRGELSAAGFEVVLVDRTAEGNRPSELRSVGLAAHAIATFGIFDASSNAGATRSAEIWVADVRRGKTVVQHVGIDEPDPDRRSAALAVHAVEILRASLVELGLRAEPAPQQPEAPRTPDDAARSTASQIPDADNREPRFAAGAGLGALQSLQRLGNAISPMARFAYFPTPALGARIGVLGLGTSVDRSSVAGTATIHQELALLEVVLTSTRGVLRPTASAGAGAYHLGFTSVGEPPYLGTTGGTWAALGSVGAGASLRLGSRLVATLDVQALFTAPRAVVTIAGTDVGRAGTPSLLAALAAMTEF
jgi:hypothetical protein